MPSSDILVDYSYLGPGGNVAGAVVLLVLCLVVVATRFWGRRRVRAGFKSDDWLILASLVLFIGMTICVFIGVAQDALGHPTPKPPPGSPKDEFLYFTSPQQQLIGKLEQATIWMQIWQLGCAKVSVVMFYRRVFTAGKLSRWFQVATITLIVVIALWTIIFFFLMLFACGTDFSANWTTIVALEEHCPKSPHYQMSLAICDFCVDMFIIILPLPIISNLHMPRSRKFAVSAVFLIGALAVAASCLRMAIFIIIDVSFINPKQDGDWTVDVLIFWAVIESGLSILAATLPSLAFLSHKVGLMSNTAIRSLRSVFSLQSLRSRNSSGRGTTKDNITKETATQDNTMDQGRFDSMSHINTVRSQKESSEQSHASWHRDEAVSRLPENSISVTHVITQRDNIV